MAHLLTRGRRWIVEGGETEAVLAGSGAADRLRQLRSVQVTVKGTTFDTATVSVAGRGAIVGSGPNGQITQSDVESFTEWDSVNLTEVTGRTVVLDSDAVFDAVRVGGLVDGNSVVIY